MNKTLNMSQRTITLSLVLRHADMAPEEVVPVDITSSHGWNEGVASFRATSLPSNGPLDPWELRDDFLSWPPDDWQVFPHWAGHFGSLTLSKRDFVEWQCLLRQALLTPSSQWANLTQECAAKKVSRLKKAMTVAFTWENDFPRAVIVCGSVLDYVIATIQLDKLDAATFRACARTDCISSPFRVTRKGRIYCSNECAHLVAVRNSRLREVELSVTKKQKKNAIRGK